LIQKLKNIWKFLDDDTPYYAASLSFFTIFSILPLIALLIVVVSNLPQFASHIDLIMLYLFDFINPTHSTSIAKNIDSFLVNTDKLGSIGLFYLLFVFTLFFKDYEYIINKIYGTKSRAIYRLFFTYLSLMILLPLLFAIAIYISTITHITFVGQIVMFCFIWLCFIILFILSANTKVTLNAAALSSLLTLIILNITKTLFGYYVLYNTAYATIYGSFSVALFFFLWIYISWNIYLYGTKLCNTINQYELRQKGIVKND